MSPQKYNEMCLLSYETFIRLHSNTNLWILIQNKVHSSTPQMAKAFVAFRFQSVLLDILLYLDFSQTRFPKTEI